MPNPWNAPKISNTKEKVVIFPAPQMANEIPYIRYGQCCFYSYGNFTPILPSFEEPHGWQTYLQLNSFLGNTKNPSSQLATTSLILNFNHSPLCIYSSVADNEQLAEREKTVYERPKNGLREKLRDHF